MDSFMGANWQGAFVAYKESKNYSWQHIRPSTKIASQEVLQKALVAGYPVMVGTPEEFLNIPQNDHKLVVFLDLCLLSSVISHDLDDQVISIETGTSVASLNQLLQEKNQWWPQHVNNDSITVADLINSGDGGCLEHGFGGPSDLVLGLSVALSNGDIIDCGGKVVKNVSGYDLKKLFIGSHASLGVVLTANLRLFAHLESLSFIGFAPTDKALLAAHSLIKSGFTLSCLELVDLNLLKQIAAHNQENSWKTLIESKDQADTSAILMQIHGQKNALSEIYQAIYKHARPMLSDLFQLETEQAEYIWKFLSNVTLSSGLPKLEIALSTSQFFKLWQKWWHEVSCPLWQFRPARQRLKLFANNLSLSSMLLSLKQWVNDNNETLVIGQADNKYQYQVHYLPKADEKATLLKQGIKTSFDPNYLLNPFVSL